MTSRLFAAILAGVVLASADRDMNEKANEAAKAIEIPQWKLDLVTGKADDWWTTHVTAKVADIKNALWGNDLPVITSSPAQDRQRCPIIKLPSSFYGAAKYSSWNRLYGEWNMGNDVTIATFEQNYLMMGFSRDVKRVGLLIKTAATGEVAIRTRPFSDEEMLTIYNWQAPSGTNSSASPAGALSTYAGINGSTSSLKADPDFNLAIFDCVGTLMYVVKEKQTYPKEIMLYSRDGTLVSSSHVGAPILRYQFVDPSSGYLLATAEAPGINSSIERKNIPTDVEVGDVLPFGFKFEQGGYTNSSALMENEYRWVLATAVQALAVFSAETNESWVPVTVVEMFLITCMALALFLLGGTFFGIYRCVYPGGHHELEHYYGRLAENPFLAKKDPSLLVSTARDTGYGAYGAVYKFA